MYYLILYLFLITSLLCGAYLLGPILWRALDLALVNFYTSLIALARIVYESPILFSIKFLLVFMSCGILIVTAIGLGMINVWETIKKVKREDKEWEEEAQRMREEQEL
ncbi:hypothetical protein BDZ45DRAFT_684605 [Acephala macrosclerotiorum]|nr:hypothetical protein BDZ45DRAFT_684605 [Acephala macrosclerotiorum]